MTLFMQLLSEKDKQTALLHVVDGCRRGETVQDVYDVEPEGFLDIPGSSFAYWITDNVRNAFSLFPGFSTGRTIACITNPAGDDTRYLRSWWEVGVPTNAILSWKPIAKGGSFSPYYYDVHLVVAWNNARDTYLGFIGTKHRPLEKLASVDFFFRPGITWPSRTQEFGPRILPAGCIFTGKGPAAFDQFDSSEHLLANSALMNSAPFKSLVGTRLNAADSTARSFEVGIIQKTPAPPLDDSNRVKLATLARDSWSLRYSLDTIDEVSHAFWLPAALRVRLGSFDPAAMKIDLFSIQSEINAISFDLYNFDEVDRAAMQPNGVEACESDAKSDDDAYDENSTIAIDDTAGLLSWTVGVAFGRFDWRLATSEREAPAEPEPFDPLPTKSPGMLPDGAEPFHAHTGILVDDEGHTHDLPHLLEEILQKVDAPIQVDIRRWQQREFFPFHLQRYSKSRRKAPIYWPLSTLSGAYTLWLYYPALTSQTLFTAVNDFIEPKLKQVRGDLDALRGKGNARSKQEEKQLEIVTDLAQELADLRDALLAIAPKYFPNHDDGVQITAAPLWQLFRHKPWQKVLNDTWEKLEQGDYDWSNLAMNYWPERVLDKCHQDRSLAVAHGVEDIFWNEVEVPVMRGKKATGQTKLEWQPKELTEDELNALIQAEIKEMRA